jgi:hypothetical protein
MDRSAGCSVEEEVIAPSGESTMGGFAIELRDRVLPFRTRVLACEKAVSHRGGTSAAVKPPATEAGMTPRVRTGELSSCIPLPMAEILPSSAEWDLPSPWDAASLRLPLLTDSVLFMTPRRGPFGGEDCGEDEDSGSPALIWA